MQGVTNFTQMTCLWRILGISQNHASLQVNEENTEIKQKCVGFVLGGEIAKKLQERMRQLDHSYPENRQENQITNQADGSPYHATAKTENPSPEIRNGEDVPPRDPTLPPALRPNLHAPLPQGFSPEVYLYYNKDAAQHYGVGVLSKSDAAFDHYMKFGYKEKRAYADKYFDPESYLALNGDVAAFATNYSDKWAFAAFHRYVLGPHENRPYVSKNFDAELYIKLNPDVAVASHSTSDPLSFAVTHYLSYGRNEQRQYDVALPSDFVAAVYYQINDDVLQAVLSSGDDLELAAKRHYRYYGYFEKRAYRV